MKTFALLFLGVVLLVAVPDSARACGPGHHAREASRLLELLGEVQPDWAARAQLPHGLACLHLGSALGPDFQWALGAYLGFGHDVTLSYQLLDLADQEDDDLHRLFALGHLAHMASDPACEQFLQPTLVSSAPVGVFDMWKGEGGNQGEQGSAQEAYGDLITGDWDALVDMLYDFHLDGDDAKARFREVFTWYCENGKTFTGGWADCPGAVAAFEGMLQKADQFLGGMTREKAHQFVHALLDKPLPQVADLYATGLMSSLTGGSADKTDIFDAEFARFRASPLTDPTYWALYDQQLADLGPRWGLERYLERLPDGWPGWEGNALVCGNVAGVMRFGPEAFDVQTGLIVDGVWWWDAPGHDVAQVTPDLEGASLTAHVRFYSSLPFTGTVTAIVRQDLPGADGPTEAVAGEASVDVAIDPTRYLHTPRTEVDVPFVVHLADGPVGFVLDLYAHDVDLRPSFTTSWDRIWTLGDPQLDLPMREYRASFGTCGFWPPSLPVAPAEPQSAPSWLYVVARDAASGEPVPGAFVSVGQAAAGQTGGDGLAVFADLAPASYQLVVTADGHESPEPEVLTLGPAERRWLDVPLTATPAPEDDQPEAVEAEVVTEPVPEPVDEVVPEPGPEAHAEPQAEASAEESGDVSPESHADATDGSDISAEAEGPEPGTGGGGCAMPATGHVAGSGLLGALALLGMALAWRGRGGRLVPGRHRPFST